MVYLIGVITFLVIIIVAMLVERHSLNESVEHYRSMWFDSLPPTPTDYISRQVVAFCDSRMRVKQLEGNILDLRKAVNDEASITAKYMRRYSVLQFQAVKVIEFLVNHLKESDEYLQDGDVFEIVNILLEADGQDNISMEQINATHNVRDYTC